jgi:hypothetical protein
MTTQIKAELLIGISNWQKGLTKASKEMAGFGKSMRTLSGIAKGALAFLSVDLFAGFVRGAELARQSDQKLQKVAESMKLFGERTSVVTKELQEYADKLELSTGFQAEQIKQVQTTLLTFKQIGKSAGVVGGIFERTTEAALDLAAAGFGTVESNAKQLGKALNDPIKGLTSLTKAGVTFTDSEKKRIKTLVESNKLGEAQVLVLEAIEKQVGGVAESSALTSKKLENLFGQIADAIGEEILPVLDDLVVWFSSAAGKDALQQWIKDLKFLIQLAGDFLGLVRNVASLFDQDAKDKALSKAAQSKNGLNYLGGGQTSFMTTPSAGPGGQMSTKPTAPIQYININTKMTANEIALALSKRNKNLGLNGF